MILKVDVIINTDDHLKLILESVRPCRAKTLGLRRGTEEV